MLTIDDENGRRRAHEDQLLAALRHRVDLVDAVGVLCISVIVPIALEGYVSLTRTIPWMLLSFLCVAAWTHHRLPWHFPAGLARAGLWGSSLVWAALPWLVGSAFEHDEVAVILLAICGFGLATDALFVPQTVRLYLSPMMLFYATSYVIAFMVNGRWLATIALTIFTSHLVVGSAGIEAIKRRLFELEEGAAEDARTDPLTGLASRTGARSFLQARLDEGQPVACIAIDIDYFSAINAHLGSQRGDALLRLFATRLTEILDGWFLARLRGDQFLAIGHRPPSIEEIEALPIIELHGELTDLDRQTVSVSAGIATTETANSVEALRRQSGLALRRAKRQGRQQVVHATQRLLAEAEAETLLAERALEGLTKNEFIAWAQPIVDLDTGAWVGFELLARWPQPDGTIVTPDRFVPMIEAQGASRELGHAMLDQAVDLLARLADLGRDRIFVSVNLSPLHLVADDLPDRIGRATERTGIDPTCLVLEMTEGQRPPEAAATQRAFERLRAIGVGIASDDVGSGWSSLNQLLSTPFTHVKIDRDLIQGAQRRDADDLLSSIRDLAAGAGQVAIAEGIENEAERAFVRRARFRLAQGYLFARPMPIDDAIEGLDRGSFSADIA